MFGNRARRQLLVAVVLVAILAMGTVAVYAATGTSVSGLDSPTHPDEGAWVSDDSPTLIWDAAEITLPGYSFDLTGDADGSGLDLTPDPNEHWLTPTDTATPVSYGRLASADFDKDGALDVVAINPWSGQMVVHRGHDGSGTFPTYDSYPGIGSPWDSRYATGPVIEDFNNDTWPDISFIDGPSDGSTGLGYIFVFTNDGDGTFTQRQSLAATTQDDLCSGDLNQDGNVDLVVSSLAAASTYVHVYLGDGTGSVTFAGSYEMPVATGDEIGGIAVGDFDGNGTDDVAATAPNDETLVIFPNTGVGGVLGAPVIVPAAYDCGTLRAADVNGDGYEDILSMNRYGPVDEKASIFVSDGAGGWARTAVAASDGPFTESGIGDFDGDGELDVVFLVSTWQHYALEVMRGNGDGTFEELMICPTPDWPSFWTFGDFDSDGYNEVCMNFGWSAPTIMQVGPATSYDDVEDGVWYFHVRAIEQDLSGGPIATRVVRIDTTAPEFEVGGVTDGAVYRSGEAPQAEIGATDPNMPDASGLATFEYTDAQTGLNVPIGGDSAAIDMPVEPGRYEYALSASDFAGNASESTFTVTILGGISGLGSSTHPDQDVWYLEDTARLSWLLGPGAEYSYSVDRSRLGEPDVTPDPVEIPAILRYDATYPMELDVIGVATGDMDNDGDEDVVAVTDDDYYVGVQLNNGDGTFDTGSAILHDTTDPTDVALGDFDEDGILDVVSTESYNAIVNIWIGNGDGTLADPVSFDIYDPCQLTVADFDGDGHQDIAVTPEWNEWFDVMFGDGTGDFTVQSIMVDQEQADEAWGGMSSGDYDGDGDVDLAFGCAYSGLCVAFNDGAGGFSSQVMLDVPDSSTACDIASGDLDGDGMTDIVAIGGDGALVVYQSEVEGGFNQVVWLEDGPTGKTIDIADVNADGYPDVVLAAEDGVGVFVGDGAFGFDDYRLFEGPDPRDEGMASADFDGDGIDDVVSGTWDASMNVFFGSDATDNLAVGPLEDGIWYFHLWQVAGEESGPMATFRLNIGVEPPSYTLSYEAGDNCSIEGSSTQIVHEGYDGESVTALPDPGFQFTSWSDGLTTATRTDQNVMADVSVTASVAPVPTQTYDNGLVRMRVGPQGRPGVAVKDPTSSWVEQYYATSAWGTVVWLDGASYGSGYVSGTTIFTPVSNTLEMIAGGARITTVLALGDSGVRLTQTFTLMDGERVITKDWSLSNESESSYSSIRLYHGGDTYFGGEDSASGYYDAAKSMVYIRNSLFADWGIMGFYSNPGTPADHYFEGQYSTGNNYARTGADLPDTVNGAFLDAGYYLQWKKSELASGQRWDIQAYEIWTPGGAIQILGPGRQNVLANTTVTLPFTIRNLSQVPQDVALSASCDQGWDVAILGDETPSVGATEVTEVFVRVSVPAGADGSAVVTLNATGPETDATGSSRLDVVDLDVSADPDSLLLHARPGEPTSATVTVTNNSEGPITFGTLAVGGPFSLPREGGGGVSGTTLAPGASAEIEVGFVSASEDIYLGLLRIPIVSPVLVTRTVDLIGSTEVSRVTLSYTAGPGGSIEGSSTQVIEAGGDGTEVLAVPNPGYKFVRWDDGELSASRTDVGVAEDLDVTAEFAIAEVSVRSVAGTNRYATSVRVSRDAFPDGSDAVVIATGAGFPDALAGSALAGVLDAPVLLTERSSLPPAVVREIERLGASEAYVLGGTGSVSRLAFRNLVSMLGVGNVRRIGGPDRYRTAELVAEEVVARQGDGYDGTAFVATGEEFADALAAAPLAAANGWPVYLAPSGAGIGERTTAAMLDGGVTHAIVLGGRASVPQRTSSLMAAAGFAVSRIDGDDRYETAALVAEYGVSDGGLRWDGVALATGESFADALAGGPAQGVGGSVMLLTRSRGLPGPTAAVLDAHTDEITTLRFLGGLSTISQRVRDQVAALF